MVFGGIQQGSKLKRMNVMVLRSVFIRFPNPAIPSRESFKGNAKQVARQLKRLGLFVWVVEGT